MSVSNPTLRQMANVLRFLSVDAVEQAKSGHPGMPMGMADVATVLFSKFLKFDPEHTEWPDRDRFVLSAGHGSMLLYSLLHLTGYKSITLDEIKRFRQLGSKTPGHPEVMHTAGIETTTGPLGQGFANAVGMALAERIMNARFGYSLVDHHTFVIASDGDLMEGISHEAAALAGHLGLSRLIVLWDDNGVTIDGSTSLAFSEDVGTRFRSYGWNVKHVDGHDLELVEATLANAMKSNAPSLIACKTVIGFGAPTKAGTSASHGAPLGAQEVAGARKALNWPYPPFEIPADIAKAWREIGMRNMPEYKAWGRRLAGTPTETRIAFEHAVSGHPSQNIGKAIHTLKQKFIAEKPNIATRAASGNTLEALVEVVPELIGGSADLTGSNNTYVKSMGFIHKGDYSKRYIHYGVREHAMAGIMSGMALHGGIVPYGGTFLIFSDYCRPSIRLASLMKQRVVYVMTHDSIGLGEDGPTHQPVEQLAALRAIPSLRVFRPCDAVETAECWELALTLEPAAPSVLALTRQGLPTLRKDNGDENLCARGAYVLAEAESKRQVTLLATGSEVEIAMQARTMLEAKGVGTAVVSMPCWALFDAQSEDYKRAVLGDKDGIRIAIEAAARFGWDKYIGAEGGFVGMHSFGESAPYKDLYKHFGITAEAVVEMAVKLGSTCFHH